MRRGLLLLAILGALAIPPAAATGEGGAPTPAGGEPSLTERYHQALAIDPDNLTLRYFLGVALLVEGRNREAAIELSRAYPAYADSAELHYNLGLAFSRLGDADSALLYFEQAEALGALEHPDLYPLANAYFNLALTHFDAGALDEADRLFCRVLAIDPARAEVHRLRGDLLARRGDVEGALSELDAFRQVYPDDTAAQEYLFALHFNRGVQCLEQGDRPGARASFDQAAALRPGHPLALFQLGYLDYQERDFETAAARLGEAWTKAPEELRESLDGLLYNIALNLLEQRKSRLALTAVEPLLGRAEAPARTLFLAGNIYLALGEFSRARTCYLRVLAAEPGHRGATLNLATAAAGTVDELVERGRSLFASGLLREALQTLEEARTINPADPRPRALAERVNAELVRRTEELFTAAEASLTAGAPREALDRLREAEVLTPGTPRGAELSLQALEALGRELERALTEGALALEEGRLEEADRGFDQALQFDPACLAAREGKAMVADRRREQAERMAADGAAALAAGRFEQAREAFDAALRMQPDLARAAAGLTETEARLEAAIAREVESGRRELGGGRLEKAHGHFAAALRLREDPALRQELERVDQVWAARLASLLDAARRTAAAGDFRRSREIYRQILAERPQQETALRELAALEVQAEAEVRRELAAAQAMADRDLRGAIARYRKALDIDPGNDRVLRGLEGGRARLHEELSRLVARGSSFSEKGDLPAAEAAFREVLAIDPYHGEARSGLKRIEQLRKSGAQPGDEKELYLRGIELYTRGRYEEAVVAWEQVLVLAPNHEKARMNIDKARRKLRQIQEYRGG